MLFLIQNQILTNNREKTSLTAAVAAAGTSLSVRAVDADTWSDNDWIIVGEIGSPNAEVLQINGAVSDGITLTVDNAGSGGCRYAHSVDEPVYRLDYNQIKIYRATTTTGTKTLLDTVDLQPQNFETRYDDIINSTGFGFASFFNSVNSNQSPYSDPIPYTGQSEKSLFYIRKQVRKHLHEQEDNFITDEEIDDAINTRHRDVLNERLWTFNEMERSTSSVANQFDYPIDSEIKTVHTARFNSTPLTYKGRAIWENYHFDTDATAETPSVVTVWNGSLRFYPRPSTAATNTTLDGDITDTSTTITVASLSGFKRADYYRFTINDEVIYATGVDTTNNQFTGCVRAQEGTTAAAHSDTDTVTERNIVYTGQAYAVTLDSDSDETTIPEPDLLAYGAAADLATGKLGDSNRGDRFEAKYEAALIDLKNKFSLKFTSQMPRVKTAEEARTFGLVNPNDHPTNVQAS